MATSPQIAVIGRLHDTAMVQLEALGTVQLCADDDSDATIIAACHKADAITVRTRIIPSEAITGATALKVVARHGVGYNNIPVDTLTQCGIPLALVGGANAHAVAEHAIFLMLAASRQANVQLMACRSDDFAVRNRQPTHELGGKTLGILGFGRIGSSVARIAIALGMQVLVYDPMLSSQQGIDPAIRIADSIAQVMAEADVLTLHLPLLPDTAQLINSTTLKTMRPGAILINTARGELVDEDALLEALSSGHLAAAGLDVLTVEPPRSDHPLVNHPHVVVTPHSAALTEECFIRMGQACVDNVRYALFEPQHPDLLARIVNM